MTKEDFAPDKIKEFLYAERPEDIINVGSYSWFHSVIPEFEPHDYDYIILMKSDHNEILKYHYMYCDYWVEYYPETQSKEDFIKWNIDKSNEFATAILKVVHFSKCTNFNITYEDIEPYIDIIKEKMAICAQLLPKLKYIEKIFDFMVENKSLTVTEGQIKEAYQIYVEAKKQTKSKYCERMDIPNTENTES